MLHNMNYDWFSIDTEAAKKASAHRRATQLHP
jgi:hypothetical protein